MKQYDEYKTAKAEWYGQIPGHWHIGSFKHLIQQNDGGVWGNDPAEGEGTIVLRSTEIKLDGTWNLEAPAYRKLSESEIEKAALKAGDLLITKSSGSEAHIGKTALVTDEMERLVCCYSNFTQRIRLIKSHDSKFFHYFLNSPIARSQYNLLSKSAIGLANLSGSLLGSLIVPKIPLPEQRAIAAYLDRKTAQLDQLLKQKEALRQRLQQQRKAIINEAVTRGLDVDAPQRASGVAWLGDVPAHWEVKKLKYTASLKSGDTITAETIELTGEYPVYGGNGLRGYTDSYTHEGDFALIGRQGALCGNINYASGKFFASEHALVAAPLVELETVWLGELLRTMNLGQYSQASAQPGISADRILNLLIPVPPLSEQRAIVAHIEAKTSKITAALEALRKQLKALAAYRQALVAEVVTGKVDVRGEQPIQLTQGINMPPLLEENQIEDAQPTASGQLRLF